ncbi:MAG: hypothetical protein ACJAV2_002897 [Myxococcota bacterium]|jgi:hypothetical protein
MSLRLVREFGEFRAFGEFGEFRAFREFGDVEVSTDFRLFPRGLEDDEGRWLDSGGPGSSPDAGGHAASRGSDASPGIWERVWLVLTGNRVVIDGIHPVQ